MAKGAILLGTAHNFKKNSEGAMNGWMDVIQCAKVKVIHLIRLVLTDCFHLGMWKVWYVVSSTHDDMCHSGMDE